MLHLVIRPRYKNIFLCKSKNTLNFVLDTFICAKGEVTAQGPDYILLNAANQSFNLNC